MPIGSLIQGHSVRNRRPAGKCIIAEGHLPVPGNNELRTVQKLRSIQEGPAEVGAIERGFEKVCPLQIGTRQVRLAQIRSSEIGSLKIRARKIKPAQVEPAQTGPRQVRRVVPLVPPCIPCPRALSKQGNMLIAWHFWSLSNFRAASFRC